MLTIAYVRVSTDDQVEHSPDAQRRRCADYAKSKGLDVPRFLSDEGWSGKNLERPAMAERDALAVLRQQASLGRLPGKLVDALEPLVLSGQPGTPPVPGRFEQPGEPDDPDDPSSPPPVTRRRLTVVAAQPVGGLALPL